jgi:Protein of unknown function (DUF779)
VMSESVIPARITATPAAREAITAPCAAGGGAVMFVQSGGCCAGSTPMCFPVRRSSRAIALACLSDRDAGRLRHRGVAGLPEGLRVVTAAQRRRPDRVAAWSRPTSAVGRLAEAGILHQVNVRRRSRRTSSPPKAVARHECSPGRVIHRGSSHRGSSWWAPVMRKVRSCRPGRPGERPVGPARSPGPSRRRPAGGRGSPTPTHPQRGLPAAAARQQPHDEP